MHEEITKVNHLKNRGMKKANFHVLRETTMSALLTENGFIDNNQDADLLADSSWRQTAARGHVNGLAKAFNLEKKEISGTLYKIIAGAFLSKENADNRVSYLQSKGIESFVTAVTISGDQWYRIQAGAFSNEENANARLQEVRNAGIKVAYMSSDVN